MVSSTFRILATSALAVCAASAQPTVSAVLNNASYALSGLPNSAIAQGSLMAIFGTNLATGNMTATSFPLQANMGGTTVRITAGGSNLDALMIYTTAGQLGAILPSATPVGDATLTVTTGGQTSRPFSFRVTRSSFGIFTANQAGSGPGAIQNVISTSQQPTNALTQPARPGQTLIVWGTGLGPTTANEAGGAVPGDLAGVNVEVFVGGRSATVSYKGRSGCCAGIDQVAFVVPEGVEGCFVPVVVKTGDVVSNFATIAVARTGNVCSDPLSYNATDVEAAQNNGNFRLGIVSLNRTRSQTSIPGVGSVNSNMDTGFADFSRYTLNQFVTSQGGNDQGFAVSLGACSVVTFRASGNGGGTPVDPIRPVNLDAGDAITVRGPEGEKRLTRDANIGGYYAQLGGGTELPNIPGLPPGTQIPGLPGATPLFLSPGSYTISAPGGTGPDAVGNFSVPFTLPALVTWSNQDAITSPARSSGLQITWTGGDSGSYVYMSGMSFANETGAMFVCIERASAQQFTIPSYVLSVLPASSGQIPGFLSVGGTSSPVRFTATGLDAGYISTTSTTQKSVTWR